MDGSGHNRINPVGHCREVISTVRIKWKDSTEWPAAQRALGDEMGMVNGGRERGND